MKKLLFLVQIIILFCTLILIFNIGFAKIDGNSMKPKFSDDNLIIYQKFDKKIRRFDIIVFKIKNDIFIKRVIGLPGETIEYKNNVLYVNGIELQENFNRSITKDFNLTTICSSNLIPSDKILVLGDNRLYSYDSRDFGLVSINDIKGIFVLKLL